MRKRRAGEVVCTCEAYPFPHRMFGGSCNGIAIVIASVGGAECQHCQLLNNGRCEVLAGIENPVECHYVADFIHQNEVKI